MTGSRRERFRYRVEECNGHFYVTSPDERGLLVAKVDRQMAIDAIPVALQRFRFHCRRRWDAVPDLDLEEI